MKLAVFGVQVDTVLIENHSMLDSGCLILEKSFTAENADFAEKAAKSTDFATDFADFWEHRKETDKLTCQV